MLTNPQRPIKPPPALRSPKELVASSFWSLPPNDNPPSLDGLTQEQKDYWYSVFDTLEETMKRGCKLMYEANQRAIKGLK
jgi:hypothetical protein